MERLDLFRAVRVKRVGCRRVHEGPGEQKEARFQESGTRQNQNAAVLPVVDKLSLCPHLQGKVEASPELDRMAPEYQEAKASNVQRELLVHLEPREVLYLVHMSVPMPKAALVLGLRLHQEPGVVQCLDPKLRVLQALEVVRCLAPKLKVLQALEVVRCLAPKLKVLQALEVVRCLVPKLNGLQEPEAVQ